VRVPLLNVVVDEAAIAAAAEVMRSGWIGMGPRVAEFEKAFAAFLGLPETHAAVAVNSGTSALHLALRLMKLERGAEVITTPNTFVATNQVMLWEGVKPVFADIDPASGLIDPESVVAKVSEKTGAIVVVHFGGQPCDLPRLEGIARKHGVPLLEDCAHACGAFYGEARTGGRGNWAAFSFGPTKALTTVDGGMMIVPAEALKDARAQRILGMSADIHQRINGGARKLAAWDYAVDAQGRRYHMNDVAAAMGLAHLKRVDAENAKRAAAAEHYDRLLEKVPGVRRLAGIAGTRSAHYLYAVLAEERDSLAAKLQERGVGTSVYYRPCTHYPIFEASDLPGADRFFARVLALPMFPGITRDQVEYVAACIAEGW